MKRKDAKKLMAEMVKQSMAGGHSGEVVRKNVSTTVVTVHRYPGNHTRASWRLNGCKYTASDVLDIFEKVED